MTGPPPREHPYPIPSLWPSQSSISTTATWNCYFRVQSQFQQGPPSAPHSPETVDLPYLTTWERLLHPTSLSPHHQRSLRTASHNDTREPMSTHPCNITGKMKRPASPAGSNSSCGRQSQTADGLELHGSAVHAGEAHGRGSGGQLAPSGP